MAVQNFGTGGGGFQVSPGINISEIDLTTVTPSVSTTVGAFAGVFSWGPIDERVLVLSENDLVAKFGKPSAINPETWFTAANFLSYSNALYISRAANTSVVLSAVANSSAFAANATHTVKNDTDYDAKDGSFNANVQYIAKYPGALGNSLKVSVCDSANAYSELLNLTTIGTAAAFDLTVGSNTATITDVEGDNGNTYVALFNIGDYVEVGNNSIGRQQLKLSSISVANVDANLTLSTANATSNATHLIFKATDPATAGIEIGETVTVTGYTSGGNTVNAAKYNVVANTVATVNSTAFTILSASAPVADDGTGTVAWILEDSVEQVNLSFTDPLKLSTNISTGSLTRYWEFYNQFNSAPGQSLYMAASGNTAAQDEVHVVVVDGDGAITGSPGNILEKYEALSRATDAKLADNSSNYYKQVINEGSRWVWWATDRAGAVSNTALNVVSSSNDTPLTLSFQGGTDSTESNTAFADLARAYDLFASAEAVDVSLVLGGTSRGGTNGEQSGNYIIDNICEVRKDCIAFISPQKADVVNNGGAEASAIVDFRNSMRSTSFAVLDSGYKYQYDKYNDLFRWVPLNGDIAGLCVRTDAERDPWFSPAGYNRGSIRNVIKLAFNPSKGERDVLYKNGINPVISQPGQGTILFGDKTLLNKPSAFDRINVRRLFIVLEKSIAAAAKSTLFEINDEFTRTQFRNLVEPFLRDVQGRRGITDFKVVCDETNNSAEVIDSNRFVGDIYIKPARSINYIQLNFVAVRSGIEFSEIVG